MIQSGYLLEIAVLCIDCGKPMRRQMRINANSIPTEGDFLCVSCCTEGCINRYFTHTVEKKTGMVIFTDARYRPPRGKDETEWKPVYPKCEDIE
jgi:hypothetical protein